jgi:GntR family transcriptional regulator
MYEQIIERFRQMILCGAMEPNSPMPSVRSLAMELSINPNTIQRAYQELERMGYIYTIKAKGSYVSEAAVKEENKRREIMAELQPIVNKAYMTGFNDDDIREMLEQSIKAHHNEHKEGEYAGGDDTGLSGTYRFRRWCVPEFMAELEE